MKFSYIPMEVKLALIYWMMNILQFLISMIQPQIHQAFINLPTKSKQNVCIIAISVEDPITAQGALDELNLHQTPRGKSKVRISLCRSKRYQITDIEDICSRFDQVKHVVSHLEVRLSNKPPTPKNIGKGLKYPQRQFWKEALFVQYDKTKNVILLSDPIPIKSFPEVKIPLFTHCA